ncbi:MAG: Ppx/GppA phosphatase family protein [Polaromonas sp.]|jgi:exopolyphosphatase/guanosine-5'-triphosphate,3'-diphosphate pyrophosphatase
MQNGTRLAAVDLGSNSFRLEIGRFEDGQIHHTDYLKETVRQGNGLDANRNLTPEAMQRGWECLARFGERLAGFKKNQVRAVATQTLREANNRDDFLSRAHQILGFPIDVIAGREEARLIYQGVAHLLPQSTERRLVIDIGGRSTEMVLGCGLDAKSMESWRVGSVAWSMKYFPDGVLSARAFNTAEIAAKAVLDEAIQTFGRPHWDTAYGSSGTVGAVSDVLAAAGWPADVVTRDGLDWLLERLIKAQSADRLKMDGLKDDRRAVIGGGVSVLRAIFDLLGIDTLHAAQGALRHGALYDLLDREETQTDLRSRTVRGLTRKFHVDLAHAERVSRIASQLLTMMHQGSVEELDRFQQKLDWAAQLHEIGSHISHNEPHKHGAYILHNADAPGFALPELHRLSLLVLGHRGKLRKLEADFSDSVFVQQLMALRLAVIFCHARREPDLKGLQLTLDGNQFSLLSRNGWAEAFPQSAYLLREESMAWEKTLCTLTLKDA